MRSLLVAALLVLPGLAVSPPASAQSAIVGGLFPDERSFVQQAYSDVSGRPADSGGLSYWSAQLRAGTPAEQIYAELIGSAEFGGTVAPITRLYYSVFGRAPDLNGLRYWTQQLRGGTPLVTIAEAMLDGAEFAALSDATNADEIVAAVYGRVLGRTPEASGLAYWTGEIDRGALTVPQFVVAVSESTEHVARRNADVLVTAVYLGMLQRIPDSSGLRYWTGQVGRGVSLIELIGPILVGPEYADRFAGTPAPRVSTLVSGLSIPWDVAPFDDGAALFTERGGRLGIARLDGSVTTVNADLSDLWVSSETGLMGLALDPAFASNRVFYSCQGHTSPRDVRVVKWQLSTDRSSAQRIADPLVAGLPTSTGRHGGCQLTFDASGALLVGTGDAAIGTTPQDLGSLGGKVLRVDPVNGGPAAGNPFADSTNANTRLVYSYGHRNVQGLAIQPGSGAIFSVEHGPDRDDEINVNVAGGNYGWNPVPGYDESVPMTDAAEFPDAIPSVYSTGAPTLALSGADFLTDAAWGEWRGGLAVAALKSSTLRVQFFDSANRRTAERVIIDGTYGRLRAVAEGPGGTLYVTTSNGSNDAILRVSP